MTTLRILGTGSYVPELVVSNADYEKFVETSDEWITTRTGMKERHIATTEPTWHMGCMAAKQALERSGVKPEELDMIVVSTISADFSTPAISCIIQEQLGAVNSFCFDINVACAGFAVLTDMVRRYMLGGDIRKALIIGAESLSQLTNYTDRGTCVLFGDGSGAMVLEKSEGIFGSFIRTDGTGSKQIHSANRRKATPFFDGAVSQTPFEILSTDAIYMNGREVYKFSTKALVEAVEKACANAGITVDDLDWIVPHQANLRILETGAKNMKVPMEKMCISIERYGNTSSASIPIAFNEAVEQGRIKRGDKVCLAGFGAGLIYAASVFEY